jgi:MFS transporter, DHA2 family, multidrug resistance protein
MIHRSALVNKLDINNPTVMNRVQSMQQGFMAKGLPSNIALQSSYQSLDYAIGKQASVLSYMDVFLYLGILFLICVPFVLLVKGGQAKKVDLGEAMH